MPLNPELLTRSGRLRSIEGNARSCTLDQKWHEGASRCFWTEPDGEVRVAHCGEDPGGAPSERDWVGSAVERLHLGLESCVQLGLAHETVRIGMSAG